eukprot:TRINITY_DN1641_c0_g1_i1.p1 TRINITY_DN1641_c0_g1~~TRINITY_DN1641_c0_g1_i1.p1  ORF type:complete len:165 (+),score=35.32 TRINITY_DN1641_c0_g1_i1:34-528(+)
MSSFRKKTVSRKSNKKSPLFYSPRERAFPELMKELLEEEPIKDTRIKYNKREVMCILMDYCKEFWRHEIERRDGLDVLWQQITRNNDYSYFHNVEIEGGRSAQQHRKTRWMEITETLISQLLRTQFNPDDAHHLKRLVEYKDTVKDEDLKKIITNYCNIVSELG